MATQQSKKDWTRHLPVKGLSLQQRLPLVFCILMLAMLLIFGISSYLTVKNSSRQVGQERLRTLTSQVSLLFGQSTQNLLTITRSVASQAEVLKYVSTKDSALKTAALTSMNAIIHDSLTAALEIRDQDQHMILNLGRHDFTSTSKINPKWMDGIDTAGIGDLYLVGDSIYYPIVVAVNRANKTIGYIVRWRILRASSRTIQQLSGLFGANAIIYVGNADGNLWTNLLHPTPNPMPEKKRVHGDIYEYESKDGNVMATVKPIIQTPWVLLVEFSISTVQEASDRFLQWLIIIGSILIAAGSFIAWLISRNMTRPLKNLTNAASLLAQGNYGVAVEVDRLDEIGKLGRAFNAMATQIQKAHSELEQKITETATMNEELRRLSAHLQNIREDERKHVAREMHDQLGQLLTSFKMDVFMLKKKLASQPDPLIQEKLQDLEKTSDEAVQFVRKLAAELRPGLLDDLGLVPALEWHSREFEKRFGIEVNFHTNTKDLTVPTEIATGVFRIYQESLTNIARHSGARNVTADLEKEDQQISLSVTDNGKGFTNGKARQQKTLGLLGMKERAHMIGGQLEIDSEPGRGTTITIVVPL